MDEPFRLIVGGVVSRVFTVKLNEIVVEVVPGVNGFTPSAGIALLTASSMLYYPSVPSSAVPEITPDQFGATMPSPGK